MHQIHICGFTLNIVAYSIFLAEISCQRYLEKEVLLVKMQVSKTTSLPVEVDKVYNDVTGLVENVNTFGGGGGGLLLNFVLISWGFSRIFKLPKPTCCQYKKLAIA